jgi:hypothetical protein
MVLSEAPYPETLTFGRGTCQLQMAWRNAQGNSRPAVYARPRALQ